MRAGQTIKPVDDRDKTSGGRQAKVNNTLDEYKATQELARRNLVVSLDKSRGLPFIGLQWPFVRPTCQLQIVL